MTAPTAAREAIKGAIERTMASGCEIDALLDAIFAAAEAAGFAIVPREPTQIMLEVGIGAAERAGAFVRGTAEDGEAVAAATWVAMLAAARG